MEKYIDDDKIHQGHRSRMREKLSQHGQFIFVDSFRARIYKLPLFVTFFREKIDFCGSWW